MKQYPRSIITLILTLALFLGGCDTTSNPAVTLALEQVAANVVISKLPPAKQVEVRKYVSSVAVLVRSLDPAHPLTTEQFQALVEQWLSKDASIYRPIVTLIASSYSSNIAAKVTLTGISPQKIEQFAKALDAFVK